MHFYAKGVNRHGGESDSYQAHVSRGASGEVSVDLTWPTKHGNEQQGEVALEPDAARWLAYALLKAVEERAESTLTIKNGERSA